MALQALPSLIYSATARAADKRRKEGQRKRATVLQFLQVATRCTCTIQLTNTNAKDNRSDCIFSYLISVIELNIFCSFVVEKKKKQEKKITDAFDICKFYRSM